MKIGIISDTHLGKHLKTNTTLESRQRLKDRIFDTAIRSANMLQAHANATVHTADLFDRATNDESIIAQGSAVADLCDYVMFGNHDDRNRKDSVSSIRLLKSLAPTSRGIRYFETNWERNVVMDSKGNAALFFVPHCVSQGVFEECLKSANQCAGETSDQQTHILFLHANFDNDLTADHEQSLNLTKETAERLLEVFDFIVMGHEHQLSKHFDGRLICVGTTHPTSFSDISDKFVTVIDTETKEVEHVKTWSCEDKHLSLDIGTIIRDENFPADAILQIPGILDAEFIDIQGDLPAEHSTILNDAVAEIWKNSENLIALRTSKVQYKVGSTETTAEDISLDSLPEVMKGELDGPLRELLEEALGSVGQQ